MTAAADQVTEPPRSTTGHGASDLVAAVESANRRSSLIGRLSRAANVAWYYRKSQLLRRAARVAFPFLHSRAIGPPPPDAAIVRSSTLRKVQEILATRTLPNPECKKNLERDLAQGRFNLLNQPVALGNPIDWLGEKRQHPSRLWSFQLHYQEYLLDLARAPLAREKSNETIWQVVADWIEGNPPAHASLAGNAWHPYCISRRLPVWAQLVAYCDPPENLRKKLLNSLAHQAHVLSKHLEFDLGGNHLLENLRGLVFAGTLLEGQQSKCWLDLAGRQLRTELPRQVLPSGEHYERSPMYHCQMLGNLLQIMHLTRELRSSLYHLCHNYACRMLDFLRFLVHPDGEIPLFGDSCFGEAHAVAEIEQLADLVALPVIERPKQAANVIDRYWKWEHSNACLLFDAGPVGAGDLPAHAHCDLLGFEASIEGQRWFVDSGVYDYDDNPMRTYCRSSAAHNVVTPDYQNQCDVWSRFRMGRRARPIVFEHGEEDGFSWCLGGHDGFRSEGVPQLLRLLLAHAQGTVACLEYAPTVGANPLTGRLHLAPCVDVSIDGSGRVALNVGGCKRWLFFTTGVMLELVEGWYCDRFRHRTGNQVLAYRQEVSRPTNTPFGWALSASPKGHFEVTRAKSRRHQVEFRTNSISYVFQATFPR